MIIYNNKEMPSRYMREDEMVIEIRSLLTPIELLSKLRNNEEITDDELTVYAYITGEGNVVTQAQDDWDYDDDNGKLALILDEDDRQDMEEDYENALENRPRILEAFEAFQFNHPWKSYPFKRTDITKDMLQLQLSCCLNINPNIKDLPDKDITELQRLSHLGDRLYWGYMDLDNVNRLPNLAEIEIYDKLNPYEQRIINESGVHPMTLLYTAKKLKKNDNNRLLTVNDEYMAHDIVKNSFDISKILSSISKYPLSSQYGKFILSLVKRENSYININYLPSQINFYGYCLYNQITTSYLSQYINNLRNNLALNVQSQFISDLSITANMSIGRIQQIYSKIITEEMSEDIITRIYSEQQQTIQTLFALKLLDNCIFPDFIIDGIKNDTSLLDISHTIYQEFANNLFTEFITQYPDGYHDEDLENFIQSKLPIYEFPVITKAEEVFKELYHGHAPRVLSEYMAAQALTLGKDVSQLTNNQIRTIATNFSQTSVSKIAKYKSPVLFALSDKLNFAEIRAEHAVVIGTYVKPSQICPLIQKGFVEWYNKNKDTPTSELVDLLNRINDIDKFDMNKSAKDIVFNLDNAYGKSQSLLMERRYNYHFSNNELAIRGRHIQAREGKMKMYMLQKDDYRNFTVGYDTHCCQHYGNAGESCVWKYTTDPFAGCVVIERDGAILAQGFVWTDEANDTLVFDNVEFANDRDISQFTSLFAAWAREMPYQNIHIGTGYNQGMRGWGKQITHQVTLPTTLSNGHCYTDYHSDARAIKANGEMLISEKTNVHVTSQPDEPTRWDVLTRPDTSFMLNCFQKTIQERIDFAQRFIENPTPELQLEAVRMNPAVIQHIENATPEAQIIAVRADASYAALIQNPCDEVQLMLFEKDPNYIRKLSNPSEQVCLLAVRKNGLLLEAIQNPTEAVIKEAVKQNGYAIKFVRQPSEEVQLLAVKSTPKIVTMIPYASERVQETAIKKDPHIIALMNNPSEHLQKIAVKADPYVINEISNPTYSAVKTAVEKNGLLIRNFQYQYPNLRMVAVQQNGYALRALKNPTDEEMIAAVQQNRNAASIIRNPEILNNVLCAINQTHNNDSSRNFELDYDEL